MKLVDDQGSNATLFKRNLWEYVIIKIEKYSARANNLKSLDGDVIHKEIGCRLLLLPPAPQFLSSSSSSSLFCTATNLSMPRDVKIQMTRVCRINSFLQSFFSPLYFYFLHLFVAFPIFKGKEEEEKKWKGRKSLFSGVRVTHAHASQAD